MANIKVLYVSANGYLGGAENVVLKIVENHSSLFQASVLFFRDGEAVELAKKKNLKVHILKNSFRLSRPWKLLKAILEIRNLIIKEEFQIVHSTMAYTHFVIGLSLWRYRCKRIWFQHGPVGKWIDQVANFFRADVVFFNSHYLKKLHYNSTSQQSFSRDFVIPLGISIPKMNLFHNSNETIVFGMAGRMTSGKAYEKAITALAELKKSGCRFKCLMAGSPKQSKDEIYFESLKDLVRKYRLDDVIQFLGHVDNMNSFYESIDVFIHTTIEPEPFGLVVAEAMAHNKLVVVPNSGGVAELVADNITGFLYGTQDHLTALLKKIINEVSSAERQKIAKNASEFINLNYSSEIMISKIETAYNEVMK